jgi:hypothetical protein
VGALIEYLCAADHERHDESAITLVEGRWAYCRHGGGADGHDWQRINPTDFGELRTFGATALHDLVSHAPSAESQRR